MEDRLSCYQRRLLLILLGFSEDLALRAASCFHLSYSIQLRLMALAWASFLEALAFLAYWIVIDCPGPGKFDRSIFERRVPS